MFIDLCLFCEVNVHIPRDKLTKEHNGYGFVEFKTEQDADYAIRIMNLIKLYGKPLRVNKVLVSLIHSFIHSFSSSLSSVLISWIMGDLFFELGMNSELYKLIVCFFVD
jgi:RNA recognition motif-containing protein